MQGGGFFAEEAEPEAQPEPQRRQLLPSTRVAHPSIRPQVQPFVDSVDPEGEAALAELEAADAAVRDLEQRGAPSAFDSSSADNLGGGSLPPVARGNTGIRGGAGRCVECEAKEGQAKMYAAFNVSVCYDCQKAHKARAS
eukprot:1106271-Pleurochrysis_carterae.AAC.2